MAILVPPGTRSKGRGIHQINGNANLVINLLTPTILLGLNSDVAPNKCACELRMIDPHKDPERFRALEFLDAFPELVSISSYIVVGDLPVSRCGGAVILRPRRCPNMPKSGERE